MAVTRNSHFAVPAVPVVVVDTVGAGEHVHRRAAGRAGRCPAVAGGAHRLRGGGAGPAA